VIDSNNSPEGEGLGKSETSDGDKATVGNEVTPLRVNSGESATDFFDRARKYYATAGDSFDVGNWLRSEAHLSMKEMSHPSWDAYRRLIAQHEKEVSHATDQ